MQYTILPACFDVGDGIPVLRFIVIIAKGPAIRAIDVNQAFVCRFKSVDGVPVLRTVESYADPASPDTGGLGIIVDLFGEIGADVGIWAFFNIIFRIRGVGSDEDSQFTEGGVGGVRIVGEYNGFTVAAALDFPVSGIDKPCRLAGGEGEQDYKEDNTYLNCNN